MRVVAQHDAGAKLADCPDHFAQERPVGFQFAVGMIEDDEVLDADHIRGGALFRRAYGDYLTGGHVRVVAAAAPGCALDVADLASGARPRGGGPARAEFCVVGVGKDHHGPFRNFLENLHRALLFPSVCPCLRGCLKTLPFTPASSTGQALSLSKGRGAVHGSTSSPRTVSDDLLDTL